MRIAVSFAVVFAVRDARGRGPPGGIRARAQPGDCVVVLKGCPHRLTPEQDGRPARLVGRPKARERSAVIDAAARSLNRPRRAAAGARTWRR